MSATAAEITVDDVLYAYALWRDGPDTLANAMARNLGVLAREIERLRSIGTERAIAAVDRGVEIIEEMRDEFWSSYQLDGVVDAGTDPEVFDELVELNEVIRELHGVTSPPAPAKPPYPDFCMTPALCAGRTSCPRNPSCCE